MYASQTLLCQSSKQILPHSHVKKFGFFFGKYSRTPSLKQRLVFFPKRSIPKRGWVYTAWSHSEMLKLRARLYGPQEKLLAEKPMRG